ncbi:MAG: hypothetical protein JSR48_11940 [Verrucomicrobia bacterium]|nr:hypothetical protein [Verrucomicrobiota bacterium]
MRQLLSVLILLVAFIGCPPARAGSDVALFGWQESRDEKTEERLYGFYLAPPAARKVFEADARGDARTVQALSAKLPKDAWMYGLMLRGELKSYRKEKITLFEPGPCGSILKLVAGSIEVDWKAGSLRVSLEVDQEGKRSDFVGNGYYRFRN